MNFRQEPDPNLPPREAAAWWLARTLTDSSIEMQERLLEWQQQSPENAAAFHKMQLLWTLTKQAKFQPASIALRKRALAPQFRINWGLAAAAGIAAFVISGGLYFATVMRNVSQPSTTPARALVAEQTYHTETGQTRQVTLSDGSVATLDSNSTLKVTYSSRERALSLLQGQASFEVAKHQNRPFTVSAGDRRVTATGTYFNVDFTANKLEVTLLEGRVIIAHLSEAGHKAELLPGQQLRAAKEGPDSVRLIDTNQAIAWRSGRIYLVNESLDEAVEEINRYSHNRIVLKDRKLDSLKVSGVFHTGRTAEFLSALKLVYPVSVEQVASGDFAVRLASQ